MLRWIKKKCTRKHSKRLRTSSISDLTISHDYTSHSDTNIYHEIDDSHIDLAYAVTSLVDIIDTEPEICPLCRQKRYGQNATCRCINQNVNSPIKLRPGLTDDDNFSWLEYDFKGSNRSSLNRSQSEIRRHDDRPHLHDVIKKQIISDDSSSSGYYETDDSSDDILDPAYKLFPIPNLPHRLPNSPSLAPKMGCKIIKRTQSVINPTRNRTLRKSKSDYITPVKLGSHSDDDDVILAHAVKVSTKGDSVFGDTSEFSRADQQQLYEDDGDIFDHLYANVCIDINNLEIPKSRKSSYTSRSHGQNRLLNHLLMMNYDKQTLPTRK